MKKIIKKNQIVLFTIALMLIVAGYMNYNINTEEMLETASIADSETYAEIGDARLVSSNAMINDEELFSESNSLEHIGDSENTDNNEKIKKTEEVNASVVQYFTQSRIDRENMYSQMIESYEKILSNTNISEAQRNIAENEITNINNRKNAIMISENLIKNKGFDDVIIFINDKSVNVILKAEELNQEQIAQVQNIIQREMNAEIDNIHISKK